MSNTVDKYFTSTSGRRESKRPLSSPDESRKQQSKRTTATMTGNSSTEAVNSQNIEQVLSRLLDQKLETVASKTDIDELKKCLGN
ncbi:hypothetical protein LSTR_LSTR012160, partial [Laodelphax striatellus]